MQNKRPIRKTTARHRRRGKGSYGRAAKAKYLPVVVILCLSVGCGYATAKYVVEPAVNYAPQLTEQKETSEKVLSESEKNTNATKEVVEDKVDVKEEGKVSGYAVQLGCFSTKSSADAAVKNYNMEGLEVVEQNQLYKIIGKVYNSKEEAVKALDDMPETLRTGAFVATIYE